MKAMVLAAGYGTRFRPVTDSVPKPLVPICNRPIIGWTIDALLAAGVDEVIVNLHHLPGLLRRWVDAEFAARCSIVYSHEREILGTGGGLRAVRERLEHETSFLLVNGDTVQLPPWKELAAARTASGAISAMLLRKPPAGDSFTSVWFDGNRVTAIGETGSGEALMFAGAHAMTPAVFDLLPDRDYSELTTDFYLPRLELCDFPVAGVVADGPWFDVGSPLRYLAASRGIAAAIVSGIVSHPSGSVVLASQESIVSEKADVAGEVRRSVIGAHSSIGQRSRIIDSALWTGVLVCEDCRIESSIVASGVELRQGTRLRNAMAYVEAGRVVAVPIDPDETSVVMLG